MGKCISILVLQKASNGTKGTILHTVKCAITCVSVLSAKRVDKVGECKLYDLDGAQGLAIPNFVDALGRVDPGVGHGALHNVEVSASGCVLGHQHALADLNSNIDWAEEIGLQSLCCKTQLVLTSSTMNIESMDLAFLFS